MTKENYLLLERYMRSCMADSAHDREHVYRVLYTALDIAKTEDGVDGDVLICACLLHDIGRPDQLRDPALCHAKVGAQKAYAFLLEQDFPEAFAEHVRSCIATHRFRRSSPPESPEARILFDADKLDVVGAIGVARTLVYKGAVDSPLYNRTCDGRISDGRADAKASFFQEYCFKLEKLYDRFYTQTGRKIALQRQNAAVSFYENLYREVGELDEQGKEELERYLGQPVQYRDPADRGG